MFLGTLTERTDQRHPEAVFSLHQLVISVTQPRQALTSLFSSKTSNSSRWLVGFTWEKIQMSLEAQLLDCYNIWVLAQAAITARERQQDSQVWCKSLFELEHQNLPATGKSLAVDMKAFICCAQLLHLPGRTPVPGWTDYQGSLTDWLTYEEQKFCCISFRISHSGFSDYPWLTISSPFNTYTLGTPKRSLPNTWK